MTIMVLEWKPRRAKSFIYEPVNNDMLMAVDQI